ncbi:bifunctional NAD(P)H-hydrate repair enzyme Nnr [Gottschalkia purinilytica]|uniref:Multifunctional fusion protein n=1 Tax=Gottschalkia purinilytica TaxID=1503 RepID=A0A0L0WCJ8_GOTPU|nr:NAD(P)H-hydrate dehydratase [Gottschalkia purinilytica]KNF09186.1 bifunctional NAD(P)H-hydrate repair enzyme Nnr [Gottschalkia purinilytica]
MIKGIGIDIIEVDRVKKAFNRNKDFLKRIFTFSEIEYIQSRNNNINTIAGLFSAKEAVSKALGTGIRDFKWTDIEIYHDELGKPMVDLKDNAKKIAEAKGEYNLVLSISHDKTNAISVAIFEEDKRHYRQVSKINEDIMYLGNSLDSLKIIDKKLVENMIPKRKKESHKGTYGRVGIIGGSKGMSGSAYLSCKSALRSGSGLVYAIVPETISDIISIKSTETIVIPINDSGKGHFTDNSIDEVISQIRDMDVIAIGSGIGVDSYRIELVRKVLRSTDIPVVIDADGINCISKERDILKNRKGVTIITPHPGELSRLLDVSISDIQTNRIKYSKLASKEYNVITVLKGNNTIVCDSHNVYINTTGNPGMATAGSGDVLTGIIASFLGQKFDPIKSSILAVYIHGLSGDISALQKGEYGTIATDILENIPYAIKEISL